MKTLALAFLFIFNFAMAHERDYCAETFKGTTETLNSYRETVVQCLNKFRPGLAGEYDRLVDRFGEMCVQKCDAERASWCQKMVAAKNNLKSHFSYECTR